MTCEAHLLVNAADEGRVIFCCELKKGHTGEHRETIGQAQAEGNAVVAWETDETGQFIDHCYQCDKDLE